MDIYFQDDEPIVDDIVQVKIKISRRTRTFRERINFNMEDPCFVKKFRMPRICVEFLMERLGAHIVHPTNCSGALTPLHQILVTLHWLGSGSQYNGIGNTHGVSKASVCRCVNRVCSLISKHLLREEVVWPVNACSVADQFFRIAGMHNIAGAIDGTLIQIDAPFKNEHAFVDRKGNHSINVMLVSGADHRFYAISSNYPGSVHDSRVLRCSSFYDKWDNQEWRPFPGAIIIGDSSYPLRKWLFTPKVPFAVADEEAKNRFVCKLKKTRKVIDSSISKLKEMFPCLNKLRLRSALNCANAINACVVLYNIRQRMTSDGEMVSTNHDENHNDHEMYDPESENDNAQAVAELIEYINIFNK